MYVVCVCFLCVIILGDVSMYSVYVWGCVYLYNVMCVYGICMYTVCVFVMIVGDMCLCVVCVFVCVCGVCLCVFLCVHDRANLD